MSAEYTQQLRGLLDAAIAASRDIDHAHPAVRGLVGGKLWEAQAILLDAWMMQANREAGHGVEHLVEVPPVIVGDESGAAAPPVDPLADTHPVGCPCADCTTERAAGERSVA